MRTVYRCLMWAALGCLMTGIRSWPQIGGAGGLFGGGTPVVQVSHYVSDSAVRPGGRTVVAIVLDIREPYHVNANTANDPFIPTRIELAKAPPTVQSSTPIFPEPHEIEFGFGASKERIPVFSGRTIIYIPVSVTPAAQPGDLELEFKVSYQACDDKQCLFPTDTSAQVKLSVASPEMEVTKINPEIFAGMQELRERLRMPFFGWDFEIEPSRLWLLLIVAAIGGMLLNFTPCVLPLIPIKIMGLSQAAGNRSRCFALGLMLALGVVAFWLALAVAVSSISGFDATNKLFQYPAFTIGVGVIICAMAIGMCGVFTISLPQWIYRVNPSQESAGGSFLFGIMTAVLSTPCTAPFMGAAAAWAATQHAAVTLSTFAAIGTGMALPYLVLSAFPFLVKRMPRTGPASELIKQVMGLLMLAAGVYFLGTGMAGLMADPPDPPTQAYWWVVALFIAAAGVWLAWRTFRLTQGLLKRVLFGGLGVVLVVLALGLGVRFTQGSPVKWVYYTPERLAKAQEENKVVVLEFTAAWCLNCHALEQTVLHHPNVVSLLNSEKVVPIKVDITGNNVEGNRKLLEVGRRTIPYLVVYSRGGKEVFASDAYTVEQLMEAVERAER